MQVKESLSTYPIGTNVGGWVASFANGSGSISMGIDKHVVAYKQSAAMCVVDYLRNNTGGADKYELWVVERSPRPIESTQHNASHVLSLKEKINNIRSVFSLSVTQMAEVMCVERITVYDWIRKDSMDSVRGGSRERLNSMNELATTWGKYPALGGKFLFETLPGGGCVMELLSARKLETSAILRAYALLDSKKKPAQRFKEHFKVQSQNTKGIGTALKSAFQQLEANSSSKDSV